MNQQMNGPDPKFIQNTFSTIAGNYDKANDAITMGMVRVWRRKMIELSQVKPGDQVLDCATGTGDLALLFKREVGDDGHVIGTDFCQEMLDEAPKKADALNLDVEFAWADAMELPFENNRFDVVSIGYGIRNVADPVVALSEMSRVCKPGGRVIVLETGDTRNPVLQPMIDLYFKYLVPRIGGWVGGNKSAYEYLNKSSGKFPSRMDFLSLMQQTGTMKDLGYKSLMGGASFIYWGTAEEPTIN